MIRAVPLLLAVFACLLGTQICADTPAPHSTPVAVATLMQKELEGEAAREVQMLTVEYAPGGSSPPHQHHAQVFVYVLSGRVRMQVRGSQLVTLGPGQTFYERPADVHVVSANASKTEPAKMLVVMVKAKGETGKAGGSAH